MRQRRQSASGRFAAAAEALRYGETHPDLLRMEAEEEKLRLAAGGVSVGT